ncbi:RICIN domain-containing protein [Rhodococcus marinonascens]|uniref:RICIN domain-containing protein n=1 Tax=Rhodococcus marinonascens TaxID=38311 RepID=UPI000934831C|nr:RICIN domain-containing protein [Rhodococcus marinonascens]
MKSVHRWVSIAATATTLAAGTLLFPGGVASALDPLPGNDVKTTDVNFQTSCRLIGPNRKPNTGTAFNGGASGAGANAWGVQIMAPETVTRGQEFTYRIQPDPITTHKILDDGSLVLWRNIRYDVDIPPGTEFVSAKVASDPTTPFQNTPTITRIDPNGKKDDNGSILRMDINEEGRPSDLNSDEALAFEGGHSNGWATEKNPGFLTFPAMDITLKADSVRDVIEPTLRVSTGSDPDANTLGSADNFFRVIAVSHNNAGDSDTIVYCAPLDTTKSTTVNAGGMPLTSIKVIDPPIYGLDGRVLDIVDNGTANGTRVQMWDPTGAENQQWTMESGGNQIVNPHTLKCLDVREGTVVNSLSDLFPNGAPIQISECGRQTSEQWRMADEVTDGNPVGGAIINLPSGKCLDVTDNVSANGTPLQLWDCTGAPSQQWNVPSVSTTSLN